MPKTLKPGSRESRAFQVERALVDTEQRTVTLAFASEFPVERWWGKEILDLGPQSIRLGRLRAGGPLLMDHDTTDQVGVIESVEIGGDRVARAVVRFGKSARADEVFADVADGIRRNVSVGYIIHKAVLQEEGDDGDVYRVNDWEPYEITLCSVPADPSVGVGRSAGESPVVEIIETREQKMPKEIIELNEQEILSRGANEGVQSERKRIADITAMGNQFRAYGGDKLAGEAIQSGQGVEAFREALLQKVATAPKPTADIGLTDGEVREFRFLRLMHALANPNDKKAQASAGFEMECSRAVADQLGRAPQGFFIPNDVMQSKRTLNVGTPSQGGNLVATDLLSQDFIELLRNAMVLKGLGARFLSGLVGNIAIPRQSGGATAYWVTEGNAPAGSTQAIDQVAMSPKTVGAYTDLTRKLLLQSSIGVEMMVRQDLATTLGLEIERVAIVGDDANDEPNGILNTAGIGSVVGGVNGGAPTWDNVVDLETSVSVANAAVGSLGYLTNAKVRGKLKKTQKAAGTTGDFIWEKGSEPLNGYQVGVTNMVPSNLTKGTAAGICSALLYGNFADLVIGLWGALDLTVDPYSNSTSGTVRIVALQDVDAAVRHAQSFSAMLDALTA